ncbi:MAG: DUF3365 domain-containing protein [Epsilonproteobacteria bacterium]|nr:DUF3365 domain-containing protein [Campylobacterota bacterium]
MKLSLFTATLLLTGTLYASEAHHSSAKQEGLHAIKLLGSTLKTQLKEKLQLDSNGTAAIAFCTAEAQALTQKVNEELPSHVKVRRTSLNLRNEANKPDALDVQIMQNYKKAFAHKSASAGLITKVERKTFTRVYKPLTVGATCLKCHGENISPEIATQIKAAYPNDAATGMKLGDFRGVIVAEVAKH